MGGTRHNHGHVCGVAPCAPPIDGELVEAVSRNIEDVGHRLEVEPTAVGERGVVLNHGVDHSEGHPCALEEHVDYVLSLMESFASPSPASAGLLPRVMMTAPHLIAGTKSSDSRKGS